MISPHSIEAEQSVLGGLLLDNTAWDRIFDIVSEAEFYRADYRLIFQPISSSNLKIAPGTYPTVSASRRCQKKNPATP